MTIAEMREASNRALSRVPKDALLVAIVVLASTASFGLGLLAGRDMTGKGNDGFWVENIAATSTRAALPAAAAAAGATGPRTSTIPTVAADTPVTPLSGQYLASKNGTKYYLPTCSGASRIKEANRVWFATREDAEASGRTAASNCPGL